MVYLNHREGKTEQRESVMKSQIIESIKRISKMFMIVVIPAIIIAPFVCGIIEARTNIDLIGKGRCRIDNTVAVLQTKDTTTKIINGFVKANGREYGHTWGITADNKIIDVVCTDEDVDYRRPVEIVNPWIWTMPVSTNNIKSAWDKVSVLWNRGYLVGFIAYKKS